MGPQHPSSRAPTNMILTASTLRPTHTKKYAETDQTIDISTSTNSYSDTDVSALVSYSYTGSESTFSDSGEEDDVGEYVSGELSLSRSVERWLPMEEWYMKCYRMLEQYVEKVKELEQVKKGRDGFEREFEYLLVKFPFFPSGVFLRDKHIVVKNRYLDIVPIRKHMVVLDKSRNTKSGGKRKPSSFYINASRVKLWTDQVYIAAQGPLPNTAADFWLMVWQQGVQMIVMLTNLQERGIDKCARYWPDLGWTLDTGKVTIEYRCKESRANCVLREFKLTNKKSDESRVVVQLHFKAWPDQGVPEFTALSDCMAIVNDYMFDGHSGPLLVHCSAGVGRTGVFIGAHSLLEQMRVYLETGKQRTDETLFNIGETVLKMRSMRPYMVQTVEQYTFMYRYVLAEAHAILHAIALKLDMSFLELAPDAAGFAIMKAAEEEARERAHFATDDPFHVTSPSTRGPTLNGKEHKGAKKNKLKNKGKKKADTNRLSVPGRSRSKSSNSRSHTLSTSYTRSRTRSNSNAKYREYEKNSRSGEHRKSKGQRAPLRASEKRKPFNTLGVNKNTNTSASNEKEKELEVFSYSTSDESSAGDATDTCSSSSSS